MSDAILAAAKAKIEADDFGPQEGAAGLGWARGGLDALEVASVPPKEIIFWCKEPMQFWVPSGHVLEKLFRLTVAMNQHTTGDAPRAHATATAGVGEHRLVLGRPWGATPGTLPGGRTPRAHRDGHGGWLGSSKCWETWRKM